MDRATIKDIAKISGFSHPTVSRVLNNKGQYYSNETKKKILKVAADLNYIPNAIAKSLKINRTRLIAYLIPNDLSYYFSILKGINKIAEREDYNISILISYYDEKKELKNIESLLTNRVEGVIIASMIVNNNQLELLKNHRIPIVIVDREEKFEDISTVTINNKKAAFLATDHLIKKGYKNIFLVCGPLDSINYKNRYLGYKDALKKNKIGFDKSMTYIFNDYYWLKGDYERSYKILESIIKNNRDIDALFIVSSTLPILASKILYQLNIAVPQDITIFGFNELRISPFVYKPISTIVAPQQQIGEEAMKILVKMIDDNNYTKYLEVETELRIREST